MDGHCIEETKFEEHREYKPLVAPSKNGGFKAAFWARVNFAFFVFGLIFTVCVWKYPYHPVDYWMDTSFPTEVRQGDTLKYNVYGVRYTELVPEITRILVSKDQRTQVPLGHVYGITQPGPFIKHILAPMPIDLPPQEYAIWWITNYKYFGVIDVVIKRRTPYFTVTAHPGYVGRDPFEPYSTLISGSKNIIHIEQNMRKEK